MIEKKEELPDVATSSIKRKREDDDEEESIELSEIETEDDHNICPVRTT
jgi:hypothetical protein